MSDTVSPDEQAILAIIAEMFEAISWSETRGPDLARFAAAVLPEATVVPSARPAAPTNIAAFADRMGGLHASKAMRVFEERALGTKIQVFGNIAVALGGYEARVDGGGPDRGANAFLFIRDEGQWKIAAMAWDGVREGVRLPGELTA